MTTLQTYHAQYRFARVCKGAVDKCDPNPNNSLYKANFDKLCILMYFYPAMLKKILTYPRAGLRFIRNNKKVSLPAIGLIVILIIAGLVSGGTHADVPNGKVIKRSVEVRSVAELSNDKTPLSLTGRVRSQTEANLYTERSGEVTGVYRTVGDFVYAGTVIAEISNTSERAAVFQAEGAVEQAQAALQKVQSGARSEEISILEINLRNANESYQTALTSALNTLLSAYATIDDAILRRSDQAFSNPRLSNPTFNPPLPDSQLAITLANDRLAIQSILARHAVASATISGDESIEGELAKTAEDARFVKGFLDDLVYALNRAITSSSVSSTDIDAFLADATTARSNVQSVLSALSTAQSTIETKRALLEVAEKNRDQAISGARSEDIASAEATLKQALGTLRVAQANLAKTLIRTPISGTLNTLSIQQGDFVSAQVPAATVSNNSALEIQTYITHADREDIAVGSDVTIEGRYKGVVTSIAPGLDPITRKIEVRIGLSDTETELVHGDSVRMSVSRAAKVADARESTTADQFSIPISALKVETDRVLVFTVDEDRTLVEHTVKEGALLGEKVIILEGLSPEMEIVLDARGLVAGDSVVLVER
ncbi:hypothetical protein COU17_00395 [Candidatus Kaiserbacteria bacterium CG10_big_fil_rev_8_21_14_0_10_49_17]|uniref:CusB-like beta-barrel domain-containing protein n=1 Tax=Candidatus Kaiserbacteria bacterium CG10_big_fil_rev_8_21_14_0_10_49_17 TaxID=1974609 RepID=A0A2M6WF63_9BACT|nr:MAG: hypothetical protein COU17_00395 [Candidatus Kaiserbacteria bacterium CG10_big_fil_rev_8_21_14_0_10_49_17]